MLGKLRLEVWVIEGSWGKGCEFILFINFVFVCVVIFFLVLGFCLCI